MSAALSGILGGQPSTTQPIATPWLSPKVVTRKRWPKVLWDMEIECVASLSWRFLLLSEWCWRQTMPNTTGVQRLEESGNTAHKSAAFGKCTNHGFAPPVNVNCVVQ